MDEDSVKAEMATRIVMLPKYGKLAASARQRFYAYERYLVRENFDVVIKPLFDNDSLQLMLGRKKRRFLLYCVAYCKRIRDVIVLRKRDIVFLQYEVLPYFPAVLEKWMRWRGIRYVYDFDDAVFHAYDSHAYRLVRFFLGRKIERVIADAYRVIAGSHYLFEYTRRVNTRCKLLPTVVDITRYHVRRDETISAPQFIIGWIGSPSTTRYLEVLAPVFEELKRRISYRLIVVGGTASALLPVDTEVRPWREETEVDDLLSFDVGIMPMVDELWARGKCGYKLLQYMACGLPVIASDIGENRYIVDDTEAGFLAITTDDWLRAFITLASDPALREKMGQRGRARIEKDYSLQTMAPKLLAILQDV